MLLGLAIVVAFHGGFVVRPAGIRISLRSEWRPLLWAIVLLAVRHLLVRHRPLHRRIASGMAATIRAAEQLPDDLASPPSNAASRTDIVGPRSSKHVRTILLQAAAVIGFYALLTVVMTYPQIRAMADGVSVNEGDPLFSTWRLAWVAHQLPRDPLHLFDANIFHPEPDTLAFSDTMIVPALMAAPLLWAGVPEIVAYNLVFLSAFARSGAAMFLLVRSLTGSTGAALLAGFVFAFLPYRFMHYAHLELQMSQWMPLALWAFHRTFRHGRIRDGLLTGLFLALQCLSSWYYGIFLCTFMTAVGAVLLMAARARRLQAVRALAAGGLLAAVLILPMTLPYFAARGNVGERSEDEIAFYSATPENYIAAHSQNVLYGRYTARFGGQERELFMGFLLPLIALAALWPPLSAARLAYALGLGLAVDASLGFNGLTYPWLHEYALPYRGLRVPARMAMVVGLALAVLAGFGALRLSRLMSRRAAGVAVLAALTLGVGIEYFSRPELKTVKTTPPPIYDALPDDGRSVLLELPLLQPDISLEPIFMYYSTFHWHPLVNGYSGFSPPSYQKLLDLIPAFPDAASIAELRRRGVTHVVIHGEFYGHEQYERLLDRLNRCRDLQFVTDVKWDGRSTRLYRLLPARGTNVAADRPHAWRRVSAITSAPWSAATRMRAARPAGPAARSGRRTGP